MPHFEIIDLQHRVVQVGYSADLNRQADQEYQNEQHEVDVVRLSNAVAEPNTVMIEAENTKVADRTVLASWRFIN